MIKIKEIIKEKSCFRRARWTEWLFVILSRDPAAPATIRFWINERIRLGKNYAGDAQLKEAEFCAKNIDWEQSDLFSGIPCPNCDHPKTYHGPVGCTYDESLFSECKCQVKV